MTSLVPRGPYSDEELRTLYPGNLQLQLVQVVSKVYKFKDELSLRQLMKLLKESPSDELSSHD